MNHPIIPTMSDAEYRAGYYERGGEYLSYHGLKDFIKNPAYLYWKRFHYEPQDPSRAMIIGTSVHSLILEGITDYVVPPPTVLVGGKFNRTRKAAKAWADKQRCTIMSPQEDEMIRGMKASFFNHPFALAYYTGSQCERVVRHKGLQSKIDAVNFGIELVWDLKTCEDLDKLAKEIKNPWLMRDREEGRAHYDIACQLAFYRKLLYLKYGIQLRTAVIGIEKHPPYRVGIFQVSALTLEIRDEMLLEDLAEFATCQETAHFPTNFETVRTL